MRARKLPIVLGFVAAVAVGLFAGRQLAQMGNTDSPGGPTDVASDSYTLDDIYTRLTEGTMGAITKSTFEEPAGDPLTGTMHTLDDIMAMIPGFIDHGDGTVTDTHSGLMWTQDANPRGDISNWSTAESYCNDLVLADEEDWRMPTIGELALHISDLRRSQGHRDGYPFINVQPAYWSSMWYKDPCDGEDYAYIWFAGSGSIGPILKSFIAYAWPVRGP
ncbi:DUF1566 domain-containing protein [Candidatus Bipolaricaulota bacterium]